MVDSLCPAEPDPCDPAVYRPLNDGSRSSNYVDGNRRFQGDLNIAEGWHRSTSPAGGDMPTGITARGGCDSRLPMYRTGENTHLINFVLIHYLIWEGYLILDLFFSSLFF